VRTTVLAIALSIGAIPSVEEFFQQFAQRRDHIQALNATFLQVNVTPDEILRSVGEIVYVNPRKIMFTYRDPEAVFLYDGARVYDYDADLEQVEIYDIEDSAQAEALFIAFDSDTRRLRDAYDATILEAGADACGEYQLRLVPKLSAESTDGDRSDEEEITQTFRELRLYLQGSDWLPCRVVAEIDEESTVTVEIQNVRVNASPPPSLLQFHVPEGTRIVENEELRETVGPGGKDVPAATESSDPVSTGAQTSPATGAPQEDISANS
jgi:outer membrane lipoprotein-sorting protein